MSNPSLRDSVAEAAQTLASGGRARDDARRDAALLARWVLRWSMEDWLTRQHEIAPLEFKTPFDDLIARRAAGEPIAYLVGTREFYGRPFRVQPGVLIPRPETEWTVEEALAALGAASRREARSLHVVDIGTGSGCLAITIALERPDVQVTATDISPAALDVARTNADLLGAGARVQFVAADLLPDLDCPPDVIVTNPPYVREDERDQLDIEVRDHEPALALFAGRDGLDVIRSARSACGARVRARRDAGDGNWRPGRRPRCRLIQIRRGLQDIPRVARLPTGISLRSCACSVDRRR